MAKLSRDIGALLRDRAWAAESGRLESAVTALYPAMAPSPTAHGFWRIYTRRGFRIPYFLPRRDGSEDSRPPNEFVALYYRHDERDSRRDESGTLTSLFAGGFSDEDYGSVDRAFRVVTDEVLEAGWFKGDPARGRRAAGMAGCVLGTALPIAAAWWFAVQRPDGVETVLSVLPVPEAYREGLLLGAMLLTVALCSSLLAELMAPLGRALGRWCERRRLRRLPAAARHYLFGPDAARLIRREHGLYTEEHGKNAAFGRYARAGVEMCREDFVTVHAILPYVRQAAVTERQRREEFADLAARLGAGFPLPVSALVEPFVDEA